MKKEPKPKSRIFPIRFDEDFFKKLEEEAKKERRALGDYIRILLDTHQDRKKRVK